MVGGGVVGIVVVVVVTVVTVVGGAADGGDGGEGGATHAHGVDFVLPKPFSLEEVERVLRRVAAAIDPGLRAA